MGLCSEKEPHTCASFIYGSNTQMLSCAHQDSKNVECAELQEERSAGILEGKLPSRYLWKGGNVV